MLPRYLAGLASGQYAEIEPVPSRIDLYLSRNPLCSPHTTDTISCEYHSYLLSISSFLQIPVEIRYEIYHLLSPRKSIILRDESKVHRNARYLRVYLTGETGSFLSLVLICKQIHNEVQSILEYVKPSHLIFSKNVHALPQYIESTELLEDKLGIHLRFITLMTFSVKSYDGWTRLPYNRLPSLSSLLLNDDMSEDLSPEYQLRKIYRFRNFFTQCLPALRQLHIYDVLQHGFGPVCQGCLAAREPYELPHGYDGPRLHWNAHLPLPDTRDLPFASTNSILHEALLTRYCEALPLLRPVRREIPAKSDYRAILDLLAHGVHMFLHDEVTVPFLENEVMYDGRWHATFHLKPPKNINPPAPPCMVSTQDMQYEHKGLKECLVSAYRPEPLHGKSNDLGEEAYTYYFSETRQLNTPIRTLPDGFSELPLRCFDHDIRLEFLDQHLLPFSDERKIETGGRCLQDTNTDTKTISIWQWDS